MHILYNITIYYILFKNQHVLMWRHCSKYFRCIESYNLYIDIIQTSTMRMCLRISIYTYKWEHFISTPVASFFCPPLLEVTTFMNFLCIPAVFIQNINNNNNNNSSSIRTYFIFIFSHTKGYILIYYLASCLFHWRWYPRKHSI